MILLAIPFVGMPFYVLKATKLKSGFFFIIFFLFRRNDYLLFHDCEELLKIKECLLKLLVLSDQVSKTAIVFEFVETELVGANLTWVNR